VAPFDGCGRARLHVGHPGKQAAVPGAGVGQGSECRLTTGLTVGCRLEAHQGVQRLPGIETPYTARPGDLWEMDKLYKTGAGSNTIDEMGTCFIPLMTPLDGVVA